MSIADTLIHGRWVIPVDSKDKILEHHSIAIDKGRIIDILPTPEAEGLYHAKQIHHLSDHAILPGLINAHTHSPLTLLRGYADDLTLMDWLNDQIWPAEQTWLGHDFMRVGTQVAMAEMVRSGTTCINECYFHPHVTADLLLETGLRGSVGIFTMKFPTTWGETEQEYLSKGLAVYKEYKNKSPLLNFSLSPHSSYGSSEASLLEIKSIAEQHALPIYMHVHETKTEIKQCLTDYGCRPIKLLFDLGLLNHHFEGVHLTHLNDEDIEILHQASAHAIHCPESNLKLSSGISPIQKLINAGINVALGTDGAASNNDLDLLGEMRTAALLGKVVANDSTAVSAKQALRMATINGAKALGIANEVGSLEKGKAADIIAIDLNAINTQPIYNPISQIVYAANSRQVTDVWVAGKQLLRQHELLCLDEADIINQAKHWQKKISK